MHKRNNKPKQTHSLTTSSGKANVIQQTTNIAPVVLKEDIIRERTEEQVALSSETILPFFDFNNEFFKILADAKRTSPTHSCIVKQKTRMSVGSGLNLSVSKPTLFKRKATTTVPSETDYDLVDSKLLKVNSKNESILKVCEKAYNSLYAFGNAWIQISKFTSADSVVTYSAVNLNPKKVLLKKHNKDGIITHAVISNNFYDLTAKRTEIPLFPEFSKISNKGRIEYSVIHLKMEDAEFDNYGMPDIVSALLSAGLEYRIPKFNNTQFENGFMPSSIIHMIGNYDTDKKAQDAVNGIKNKFTGDGKNGKMFIQATNDEKSKVDVKILDAIREGSFLELDKVSVQKIVTAHSWSLSLVGYARSGSLGSNQDMLTEYLIAYENTIKPMQEYMSNSFLNPLLALMTTENKYNLEFSNSIPTAFLGGKIDLKTVLDDAELRDVLGYAPRETPIQTTV